MFSETLLNFMFTGLMSFGNPPTITSVTLSIFIFGLIVVPKAGRFVFVSAFTVKILNESKIRKHSGCALFLSTASRKCLLNEKTKRFKKNIGTPAFQRARS